MDTGNSDSKPQGTRLEEAINRRLSSIDSGNYRSLSQTVLTQFMDWLEAERGVTTVQSVSVRDCRRYAQHLRKRARDEADDLSAASAHSKGPYFTIVRAFFGWCIDEEWIDSNPARPNRVVDELPEYHDDVDRQFWTPAARDQLLTLVTEKVQLSLDDETICRETAYRNRAVVALLAHTGVRGAELFADSRDQYRNGLRWDDVDLDGGVAIVFGKGRENQPVALPERVIDVLDRYRRVAAPVSAEWPVIPTGHSPSLSRAVRNQLDDDGWSPSDIDDLLRDTTGLEPFRRADLTPPALSKNGGRNLLKRLCEEADIDIDGEYLKPHGGRRALGSELYEVDAELAQETLRHESIETTHEAYRREKAKERGERISEVLDRTE